MLLVAGCASGPANGSGAGAQPGSASQTQNLEVTIIGNVQRHVIPWQDGLTLTRAYLYAVYQGDGDPAQLVVHRKRQLAIFMDFPNLFGGQDILLEPGDQIEIRVTKVGTAR